MPALVNSSVGSSWGTTLLDGTNVWPCFLTKKSMNCWRISFAVNMLILRMTNDGMTNDECDRFVIRHSVIRHSVISSTFAQAVAEEVVEVGVVVDLSAG